MTHPRVDDVFFLHLPRPKRATWDPDCGLRKLSYDASATVHPSSREMERPPSEAEGLGPDDHELRFGRLVTHHRRTFFFCFYALLYSQLVLEVMGCGTAPDTKPLDVLEVPQGKAGPLGIEGSPRRFYGHVTTRPLMNAPHSLAFAPRDSQLGTAFRARLHCGYTASAGDASYYSGIFQCVLG